MPSEQIVNLRHRHRDLQRQDLETQKEVSEAAHGVQPEAAAELETAKSEIAELRANLQTLLSNRAPSLIENEDTLMDANSLLTQIVFKQRALWREMMRRQA